MKEHKTLLTTVINDIVERQIESDIPPETNQAYNRLLKSITDKEARFLISRAVHVELFRLMRFGEPFNQTRYLKNLKELPLLPDAE